jgi:hypothetical protein
MPAAQSSRRDVSAETPTSSTRPAPVGVVAAQGAVMVRPRRRRVRSRDDARDRRGVVDAVVNPEWSRVQRRSAFVGWSPFRAPSGGCGVRRGSGDWCTTESGKSGRARGGRRIDGRITRGSPAILTRHGGAAIVAAAGVSSSTIRARPREPGDRTFEGGREAFTDGRRRHPGREAWGCRRSPPAAAARVAIVADPGVSPSPTRLTGGAAPLTSSWPRGRRRWCGGVRRRAPRRAPRETPTSSTRPARVAASTCTMISTGCRRGGRRARGGAAHAIRHSTAAA